MGHFAVTGGRADTRNLDLAGRPSGRYPLFEPGTALWRNHDETRRLFLYDQRKWRDSLPSADAASGFRLGTGEQWTGSRLFGRKP